MTSPTITYTIAMPQPETHRYHVYMDIAGFPAAVPTLEACLPAWTPGSYMIREYARHVQQFAAVALEPAHGEQALSWRKVRKDTWQIDTAGNTRLRLSYQVYAYELTVRTSHLDDSHGYFNGNNVFLYLPGRTSEPLALHVQTPPGRGWVATTGLTASPRTPDLPESDYLFVASDYDELIDCPVECGTHRLLHFLVDGREHTIAIWGHGNEDEQRLVDDTRRIVQAERDLFGGLPYQHYTFLLHLATGYGGLEHRNSLTNLIDRWSFQPRRSYERFLELQAHELFHAWNVKSIRPAALGPFDYQQENYTRLLWAMEGVTSYYDRLILVRAGMMETNRYLELLADDILRIQATPGRALMSLEDSSFDAWIKLYRPDENSVNSTISYYLKGSLVILLLDMEIRQRTGGAYSFDDVLRYLYAHYPADGAGIPEVGAYLEAVEATVGKAEGAYRRFFERYIAGTDELDYARGLGYVGLELNWGYQRLNNGGGAPVWLGLKLKQDAGVLKVASVRSDGPAAAAGVFAGDELIALEGYKIGDESGLNDRLAEAIPGQRVRLTLFRRDELREVPVPLATAPFDALSIAPAEGATPQQTRFFREWLGL